MLPCAACYHEAALIYPFSEYIISAVYNPDLAQAYIVMNVWL